MIIEAKQIDDITLNEKTSHVLDEVKRLSDCLTLSLLDSEQPTMDYDEMVIYTLDLHYHIAQLADYINIGQCREDFVEQINISDEMKFSKFDNSAEERFGKTSTEKTNATIPNQGDPNEKESEEITTSQDQ